MNIHGPTCHSNGIRGYGSADAKIMFIGIAPGRDEVKSGTPFTGPSGKLLNALLKSVKINREEVYTTNLICYYKDDPSPEEQKPCRARLIDEIKLVGPKIIYVLGAIACEAFTGRKLGGKSGARGAVIWNDDLQAYIIPTYHPAGILRALGEYSGKDNKGTEFVYDLYRDLVKHPYVLAWDDGAPHAKVDYEVISNTKLHPNSIMYINDILASLPSDVPVALDVETYNPDPDTIDVWGDTLLCFSIATSEKAWVFPLETIELIKQNIDQIRWPNDVRWTFHNAQFDTQIFYKNLGIWLTVHEDTMLQSYSLDERGGIHGLKPLAREYLGVGWWEETREKGRRRLNEIPRSMLYEYNAKDATYTARLCSYFTPLQKKDNVRRIYERILIPAVNAIKEISYTGIRINKKLHLRFSIEWGQMYMDLESTLQEMARKEGWSLDEEINLQSPLQIRKMLFGVLSLPTKKRTKKGAESTDQEVLEELRHLHPFVDQLVRYRHMARYYDTYITGLSQHIKQDGRIHPYVKIHGARTGRWSYGNPPVQTIPQTYERDDVERDFNRTREMFTTDSKDYVFLEVDYGKGEIWCAQALSGDKQMREDLLSGDYHSTVASNVMKKPINEVTKADRLKMKHVTFGVMYGREARALSIDIETSTLEAQIYIENFFKRYPQYTEFYRDIQRKVRTNGELVSITSRKRRFIILDSGVRALKQAVNYPIQSALGDMTELALIECHRIFKERSIDARVVLQVHDSLLFHVRRDLLPLVAEIVHEVMTSISLQFKHFPRLPIEMSIGRNWGTTKGFHDCSEVTDTGEKVGCIYSGFASSYVFDPSSVDATYYTLPEAVLVS